MIAYKLLRVRRDGSLGPLFINRKQSIPVGEWLEAGAHLTKGFAYRPGWHCTLQPIAPHLSEKNRRWYQVEVEDARKYDRPESQGGTWLLANRMRVIREVER
jgi:hypothetical protein